MTHTSTSPNYQMLASLDVGRRQVQLEGFELVEKSIEMAMVLRAKVNDNPQLSKYFDILTVHDFIPNEYRQTGLKEYYTKNEGWNHMDEAWEQDEFVLDPTKITLHIGKTGIDGMTAAIAIGSVICIVAAIAGDTSQDLKTGYLLGI